MLVNIVDQLVNLFIMEANRFFGIFNHNFPFTRGYRWRKLLVNKSYELPSDLSHKGIDSRGIFSPVGGAVRLQDASSQGFHLCKTIFTIN
jgi:hypothetical protein